MDKTIAKRWVDALRSGEYEQGRNRLAQQTQDGRVEYCCLGVLCELAVKDGVIPPKTPYDRVLDSGIFAYEGIATAMPPAAIESWAGIPDESDDSRYRVSVTPEVATQLEANYLDPEYGHFPELNDDLGLTFDEIADLIELTYLKD